MRLQASSSAVLLLLLLVSCASAQFQFRKCGGNTDLNVQNIQVSPGTITFPGQVSLNVDMSLSRTVQGLNLKIDVFRKVLGNFIKLPCLFMIGSCNYGDVCTALDRMEQENWGFLGAQIAAGIRDLVGEVGDPDQLCPFKPNVVKLNNRKLDLPALPSQLGSLAAGDYRVRVELREQGNNQMMSCFELEFRLARGD